MGDISTWSPVDNSNTAAPPDGWPENQSPSSVNNCARAMMGAIRRWYDTITAQLATITTSLTTYLPLTGGTMTGGITAPYIHSTGYIDADTTINAANLHSEGDISADGQVTASYIYSTGYIDAGATINAAHLHSTGDIGADGQITASYIHSTGYIDADTTINAAHLHSMGDITVVGEGFFGSLSCSGNLTAGPVYAGLFSTTGTITADGLIAANGGIYCSSGNIHANADITTNGNIHVDDDIYCSGNVHANGDIYCNGNIAGSFSLTGAYLHATGNVSADTGFGVGPGGAYAVINSSGSFNVTGSWYVISDAEAKESVVNYSRGLAAIMALKPVAFRYRAGSPFADGVERVGLMADDVAEIIPEMVGQVTIGDQTLSTLAPTNLVYVLVNAMKELAARVAELEAQSTRGEDHV